MKVALCLSGQVRNWETAFDDIHTKIIQKYNCDVFIHTWNVIGRHIQHTATKNFDDDYGKHDYKFLSKYNPLKSKTDDSDYEFFRGKLNSENRFYNTLMMWYSIYESNELKKQYELERNFKYDCVIRCRFDLEIVNFQIPIVEKNTIYLSPSLMDTQLEETQQQREWNLFLKEHGIREYPNDVLAYGDSESMDYYSSLHTKFDLNPKYDDNPHSSLKKHLWEDNKTINIVENNKILLNLIR